MEMKYDCIHKHFYRPLRDNSCLEIMKIQDFGDRYHHWDESVNNLSTVYLKSQKIVTGAAMLQEMPCFK